MRTKSAQNSSRYTIPKIVNETSYAITDKIFTHCLIGYSTYIKTCILNKYSMNCEILHCYICNNQSYLAFIKENLCSLKNYFFKIILILLLAQDK